MFRRTTACLFLAALILTAGTVLAQTTSRGRIPFHLDPASSYSEGCMNGLCACPVFLLEDLRGRFVLVPQHRDGHRVFYDVRHVRIGLPGGELGPRRVTGDGVYWVDRAAGQQRMTLDLSFDEGPFRTFDSGVVPVEGDGFRVGILHEEGACYGYAFELVARRMMLSPLSRTDLPDQPKQPAETVTWATLKGRYR